jgi:hypothetical protein
MAAAAASRKSASRNVATRSGPFGRPRPSIRCSSQEQLFGVPVPKGKKVSEEPHAGVIEGMSAIPCDGVGSGQSCWPLSGTMPWTASSSVFGSIQPLRKTPKAPSPRAEVCTLHGVVMFMSLEPAVTGFAHTSNGGLGESLSHFSLDLIPSVVFEAGRDLSHDDLPATALLPWKHRFEPLRVNVLSGDRRSVTEHTCSPSRNGHTAMIAPAWRLHRQPGSAKMADRSRTP